MTQNFYHIGGADIYVSGAKSFKVLQSEDDMYAVEYNGMKIKFPYQDGVLANTSKLTSSIFMENGRTAIRLKNPEVYGSPENDKVTSYSVGGEFNFKGGGKDEIKHYVTNDLNYKDKERACKFNINENDVVTERYIDAVADGHGNSGDIVYTITNKNDQPKNDKKLKLEWNESYDDYYENDSDDDDPYGSYF